MKINNFLFCLFITLFTSLYPAQPTPPLLSSASATCASVVTVVGSQADPNAPITVFADLVNIGNSQADSSGNFNFSIQANPALSKGTHSITVTQTVAGLESNPSNALNIQINSANTLNLLSANADCSGNLKVVGSNADAGSTINVFLNSSLIGLGQADASGNFNFTISTNLAVGSYNINVTQRNSAGCTSQASNSITVKVTKCSFDVLTVAITNKYGCS